MQSEQDKPTREEQSSCGIPVMYLYGDEPDLFSASRYPMYSPSASYRQVDVVSGSHQYTISG